jgi:hypothetical protein
VEQLRAAMAARSQDESTLQSIAYAAAGLTFGVHLAVANRYDFFRDELYFIACGRRPAFGYVDQPPLVPLISAASQAFGHYLPLLRLWPAIAAAAVVLVACALARLVGGGRFAVALTGIATATCPLFGGLTGTFNTSAYEPLTWTLVAYLVARAALLEDRRALLWAGLVVGLELEVKYQIPFYVIPLLLAVAVTPQRRMFAWPQAGLAALIAIAIAAPSVIWQVAHGLPFAELLKAGASGKNAVYSPIDFLVNQVLIINPLFLPLWLAGAVAACIAPRFARVRFLGYAFVVTYLLLMVLHAKDYYLAGLYAPMLALGAVVVERAVANVALRSVYAVFGGLVGALTWPTSLPILDPPQVAAYDRALGMQPKIQEKSMQGERIGQGLADQLGWRGLEQAVAGVYATLSPDDRRRAAILASNYGEAGAVDFYGPADGLPPALSGHNQYWLWGPRGYDGSVIIYINSFEPAWWTKRCRSAFVAARFGSDPYAEPYEFNRPIILCRGFFKPLSEAWDIFKNYN